jgi:rare lipoprotein A
MGKTARRIIMLLVACALAVPAGATAADPGPATGGAAGPPPATGGTAAPPTDPALIATPNVFVRRVARFRGTLPAREVGRTVTIERFDPATATWIAITSALVAADGSYLARWRADVTGRLRTRATLQPGDGAQLAAADQHEASLTVYRRARATWFGPGLYGRKTACGQRLTRTLLGVAHRRLPCGTEVALTYRGESIVVPVVDRGPFARGRRWDLTAATAKALGFTFTDRIGAVRLG